MKTVKGKGYSFAEENPGKYHGVSPFDPTTGLVKVTGAETFSSVFGKTLSDAALQDSRICAITAAMADGTGLTSFAKKFPRRFFDVAIAEGHGVAMAAGMHRLEEKIRTLQMDEAEKARKMDSLRFQIDELERAQLQSGEEEELLSRRNLLRNGEKYLSALSGADYCLSGDDENEGAVARLKDAEESLAGIRNLGEELLDLYKRLENVRCEAFDLAEIIRDKQQEFDFSPEELDAVEARSDQLYRLKKKYGTTVEDVLAYLERCRAELDAIETADDTLLRLSGQLERARGEVVTAGAALTKARRASAAVLEQRILSELHDLDMNKVRFHTEFSEKAPAADGCDTVRFLMSANAGEDLKPIAKIASGGELARIMIDKPCTFDDYIEAQREGMSAQIQ